MRITAAEARELATPVYQQHVEAAYAAIRKAAEAGQSSISIGHGFWAQEGYTGTAVYKKACEVLREDGFTVEFYYTERQFVDMGTKISW